MGAVETVSQDLEADCVVNCFVMIDICYYESYGGIAETLVEYGGVG